MSVKKMSFKFFQMSEQYWGCLDKMSDVNFSPAETLHKGSRDGVLVLVLILTRVLFFLYFAVLCT